MRFVLGSRGMMTRIDINSIQNCTELAQTNPDKRSDAVANYEELLSALREAGPEYIALADEPRNPLLANNQINMMMGGGDMPAFPSSHSRPTTQVHRGDASLS